jgi:hypothetical protein
MYPLQVSVAKTVLAEYEGSVLVQNYQTHTAVLLPADQTTRDCVIRTIQRIRAKRVNIDLRKPEEIGFIFITPKMSAFGPVKAHDVTLRDSDLSWKWWRNAFNALRRGETDLRGHFILHEISLGAILDPPCSLLEFTNPNPNRYDPI